MAFDKDKIFQNWISTSDDDFETMLVLYNNRKNSWALFTGHLALEKLAKALFVKNKNDYPPMIHDLRRLLEKSGVNLNPERQRMFDTISRFNINARYDDYKRSFYHQCTDAFTSEWIAKIKECRIWIKEKL